MAKTNQEEQRKAPILRFKGVTNDWEQVELNEIAKKRIEKNNNLVNNNVLSNSAIYGIIKQNEYFDKTIANNINNYYVVHKDDFVYNPRISNHAPFGPISRNNFNESGIMSPLYLVFYFSTKSLNNYLEMYFKSSKWYKFMYKNGNSGARADRFVIKDNDFFKMEVKIPNDKNEQNKISQILNVLNNLITLYERKSKLFSQMKEYLLDNLFAENEYPNLRFKGFTNAWEQHKLGELMEISSVKRIHMDEWKTSGIPFYRARDIVAKFNNKRIENPIYISTETYKNNIKKNGIVKKNHLLITGVGTIGIPFLITNNLPLYFKDGNVIWLKNNVNSGKFLFYFFDTCYFKKYLFEITGIGTVGTYTIENAKKTPIFITSIIEQDKIAKFITKIDKLITLYELKNKKIAQLTNRGSVYA